MEAKLNGGNDCDFDADDIVVSGISGRFPNANNVQEFEHNLYNKIDMSDEDESRWKHFHPEVPKRTGKIRNINKFDASFFSILNKHANWMDPQCRCLLEHTYEAILDAGISPQSLVGSRTGVFIGCCFSDSRDVFFYNVPAKEGYGVFGNANFYLSNRLSYALGLCGPSFTIDTACSSSAYALDCAYKYIMSGACDAAIVGGSQLVLNLKTTIEYSRLRILAPDGEFCRPFDENATGFTRADTICCIFLQRKKDSKRVYAQLCYTNSNNDGFKKEGSSFPSRVMQQKLMEDFFRDSKIDPSLVDFVEAHSTGTRLGDPEEVASIDEVFCKTVNRTKPLPIGSVKSNMGHAEASSGVASIAKILLALEKHKVAPNINITNMRNDIPAFAEGRIRVVTEVEDLTGPYISMNSFGLGGANAHALFKGNLKEKVNHGIPSDNLNRMVLWSGRTEEAVHSIFDDITKRPLDAEYIALLQNSQIVTNPANIYRGYAMFQHDQQTQKAVCISRDIQHFNGEKRPIVFVYSGIGSQWAEMGTDLLNIPIFAETIKYCHDLLAPNGIDLMNIITSPDKTLFNNVLNSYVGIISIEIALTNILKAMGIEPDYIIGHSVGEMGCAYGDGCWTAKETILAAHARGVASCESNSIPGAMAAVGLNFRDVEKTLPPSIDIACHNGIDSTTISGPLDAVREYVQQLKDKNIFAREVESSGFALHSRYITKMGVNLLQRLKEVIKDPKKRSERWLSSSYPESDWSIPNSESQFCSAEYHTKNLLNPVLFEEVTEMLPKNALTIEIAPHGLLKSILKRSLKEGIHLNLTQRDSKNGSHLLMDTLGKIFENGVDMDIQKLYPAIQYPVSRGTPMISPALKWNHSENYFVGNFDTYNIYEKRNVVINLSDKAYEFVQGHIIDGKVLFPGTGWLYLVWESFAKMMGVRHTKLKVIFENVKFLRATSLAKNQDVLVTISIHRGSGRFEIIEGKSTIAHGYIKAGENVEMSEIEVEEKKDAVRLAEPDFYKEMRLRGYYHQGLFRAIKEIRDDGLEGKIKWNNEWVTFMDCLIQFQVVMKDTRMLILPTSVRKMVVDPALHLQIIENSTEEDILFDAKCCPYMNIIQAGGIEIHGFEGSLVNRRRPPSDPVLESYKFVPYKNRTKVSKRDAAKICVQIALENSPMKKLSSVEIGDDSSPLSEYIFKGLGDLPLITPEVNYLTSQEVDLENVSVQSQDLSSFSNVNLVIKSACTNDAAFIELAKAALHENGLIISKDSTKITSDVNEKLQLIAEMELDDGYLHVMQFKKTQVQVPDSIIHVTSNVNDWIEPLKAAVAKGSVLVYAQGDDTSGIIGLINCIRKEPNGEKVRCLFVDDKFAPKFNFKIHSINHNWN
ncbi:fatty acid synthase-like [Chironomus tepperi]|uniref:fatty acid synthase-like n=1 Tax=Chironomus tepperi TaxID=113505 RepID=UPI00391F465D